MVLADEVGHVQAFMLFGCCLDAVWMLFGCSFIRSGCAVSSCSCRPVVGRAWQGLVVFGGLLSRVLLYMYACSNAPTLNQPDGAEAGVVVLVAVDDCMMTRRASQNNPPL